MHWILSILHTIYTNLEVSVIAFCFLKMRKLSCLRTHGKHVRARNGALPLSDLKSCALDHFTKLLLLDLDKPKVF